MIDQLLFQLWRLSNAMIFPRSISKRSAGEVLYFQRFVIWFWCGFPATWTCFNTFRPLAKGIWEHIWSLKVNFIQNHIIEETKECILISVESKQRFLIRFPSLLSCLWFWLFSVCLRKKKRKEWAVKDGTIRLAKRFLLLTLMCLQRYHFLFNECCAAQGS